MDRIVCVIAESTLPTTLAESFCYKTLEHLRFFEKYLYYVLTDIQQQNEPKATNNNVLLLDCYAPVIWQIYNYP